MTYPQVGATYSHREITWLKIDPTDAFRQTLSLKLDLLRLGVYWDESQPTVKKFDLSAIKYLLDQCEQGQQAVVLTVGMKAPRWPEYYVPNWLSASNPGQVAQSILTFIQRVVGELKEYQCIHYWQVENEPLDHSGPNKWSIPSWLLQQEIDLVRQLDPRPIHLNLWGDNVTRTSLYQQAANLANSIGLDLYFYQPASNHTYHGPNFHRWQFKWWRLKQHLSGKAKPLWITELQAEAWEEHNHLKFSENPGSMSPDILTKNFQRAMQLKPEVILFWGLEYWLWQKMQGRPQLWQRAVELIKQHQNASRR
jgi:hypothetical protein